MIHSTSLRATGSEIVASTELACSVRPLWTRSAACLTAERSSGDVVAAAAIASGGETRGREAGAVNAGAEIAAEGLADSGARESAALEDRTVAVVVFCGRSARIDGRGRGNGTSRPNGVAMA